MDITWHGDSCFTFKGKNATLVINPNKALGKFKADVVLNSQEGHEFEAEGGPQVFDWAGEYEVKNIPIIGFPAWTKAKAKDSDEASGDPTIVYYFEIDGIQFCHLGELGHSLQSDTVKEIGDVDILFVDGSDKGNLGVKKAVEVLESIDPRAVIPMGGGVIKDFLKELGDEDSEAEDKFTIKDRSELPEDKRRYIVLNQS